MNPNSKANLKRRLEIKLRDHQALAQKGIDNTRNNALAFWYGYSMAINEVKKMLNPEAI